MPQRTPVEHGVLDQRLGVSNKNKRCTTCGLQLKECAGHFGYIKLPLPVFHQVRPSTIYSTSRPFAMPRRSSLYQFDLSPRLILHCYLSPNARTGMLTPVGAYIRTYRPQTVTQVTSRTSHVQSKSRAEHGLLTDTSSLFAQGYFNTILKVLQCICKTCGRVLLADEERFQVLRKLKNRPKERGSNKGIIKKLSEKCKTVKLCPYCHMYNGGCKKLIGTYKIVHDPYSKNLVRFLYGRSKKEFVGVNHKKNTIY